MIKIAVASICLCLLIIIINSSQHNPSIYSQSEINNVVKNNTWISKQNNLNITMGLAPKVPVIDEKTKIMFEIRKLNDAGVFEYLNARVTMTDHDGRLFKFNNQFIPVTGGKFSVEYIFPDDGEHRVILQLYRNESAFAISSFNIIIPHPKQQPSLPDDNFLANLFKNLF